MGKQPIAYISIRRQPRLWRRAKEIVSDGESEACHYLTNSLVAWWRLEPNGTIVLFDY